MKYYLIFLADVLLLACIFEEFRKVCRQNYNLDPAHYISAPQLSWDAMLHSTNCELQLIQDKAMYEMLDGGIRGGVAMVSQRYAKANNKYMGEQFDPSQPSKYLMYWDANNLYGWAMRMPVPTGCFNWVPEEEFTQINWEAQTETQPYGYFIECDFEYPSAIQDKHNDYPLHQNEWQSIQNS